MKRIFVSAVVLLLGACAYDPPMRADHAAAAYQADLAQCQQAAGPAADRVVKQRFHLFALYPISRPWEQRAQTRDCLLGKGYALAD